MSDIIHLLPDSVANQIAAGEVIQRPASVIKELVENSLDAGATHIRAIVENAGKTLVQVIDNGKGMSDTDARLSFERHATSKIQQANDLYALHTMGFRGEALASIAAVAQVELRTRQRGKDLGTRLCIEGSKVITQEPDTCAEGANFAIRNLFFNIPARRKFLKSNQTELSNILQEFERIALAHPDIAFSLHSGETVMLELPSGNFRKRIIDIFGRKTDQQLIPIDTDTTLASIHGYIGTPASAKKKNAHQYLFVNGRFMRHPYFAKAIFTAYERLIPEGSQVPFFINFEVNPARIDVNIHPTKTEIKFEDDAEIFQVLLAAVRESLGKFGAVPAIDFDTRERPDIPNLGAPSFNATGTIAPPKVHINPHFNPFEPTAESPAGGDGVTDFPAFAGAGSDAPDMGTNTPETGFRISSAGHHTPVPSHWQEVYDRTLQKQDGPAIESRMHGENPSLPDEGMPDFETFTARNDREERGLPLYAELPDAEKQGWQNFQPSDMMQYQGRFIITTLPAGLALIDQHRAHTRILYERYMHLTAINKVPSQRLLFPEMLDTSPSDGAILEQIIPHLQEAGFDISPLGAGCYSILAVPNGTEGISPTSLVSTILDDAVTGQADAQSAIGHIIALSMAKRVAMPVGQVLSHEEMARLVEDLMATSSPMNTPDGNTVIAYIHPDKLF